jgi:hypothetical protein
MIRRAWLVTTVVAAASVVAPRAAGAQSWQGQALCAASQLSVCFSVTVTQGPSNTLTMTVVNTGTAGSLFTVGLFNAGWTPGTWSLESATRNGGTTGNDNANWSEGTQSLNNALDWGVVKANDAGAALGVGESIVFVIEFTPDFNIDANTGLAWHAGALQISEKCVTGTTGDHACVPQVVPEPISMLLLGTGLAGLGGVGALRRRRKGSDVESA